MEKKELKKLAGEVGLVKSERLQKYVIRFSMFVVMMCVVLVGVMFYFYESKIKEYGNRVVVIDQAGQVTNGQVTELSAHDMDLLVAKNVLRSGVEYMYAFSSINFDERMDLARAFFGRSGPEVQQGYINNKVREKVMQNNLRVDVVLDSVTVRFQDGKVVGNAVFTQSFVNGNEIAKRVLRATCTFEKAQLSEKNGYGMVIENWITE